MSDGDDCAHLLAAEFLHRKANALNVEPMQPQDRCRLKPPSHWNDEDGDKSRRWIGSGGSVLVFGRCNADCPMAQAIDSEIRANDKAFGRPTDHGDDW